MRFGKKAAPIELAAFGAGVVALANTLGEVQIVDTATWKVKQRQKPSARIRQLAMVHAKPLLAMGTDDGRSSVWDLASKTPTMVGEGTNMGPIALSPSADSLFAYDDQDKAREYSIQEAKSLREYKVSALLRSAVYATPEAVVATGLDGIRLFFAPKKRTVLLEEGSSRGSIAASEDGAMVCAGNDDGIVACYAQRPIEPSTYQPVTPYDADAASGGLLELSGTFVSRKGNTAVLSLSGKPKAGAKASLFRYVELKFGKTDLSGWFKLGEVTVGKTEGEEVYVSILSENKVITDKGKKGQQFDPGMKVILKVQTRPPASKAKKR